MSALALGLLADFVQAAQDDEVPMSDLGVLAAELDAAAGPKPPADLAAGLRPVLEADGPALFVAAVLLGGWVERGADPRAAAPLLDRLPGWITAAAGHAPEAAVTLEQVWRPAVAALGAWPEGRARLEARAGEALRVLASAHPGAAWLRRLLDAARTVTLRLVVPDLGVDTRATAVGIADLLQLSVLVNAAFEDLDPEAVACARGEGPQTRPGRVRLPRVLTEPDGEILPEGAGLDGLPVVEGSALVVALKNPEPFERPIGRVFSTLAATLRVGP